MKYKKKNLNTNKQPSVREYSSDCHFNSSIVFMYKLFLLTWKLYTARQVQDYNNIKFFVYKGAISLRNNTVIARSSASRRALFSLCYFRCHPIQYNTILYFEITYEYIVIKKKETQRLALYQGSPEKKI